MKFLNYCFLNIIVMFGFSLKASQEVIQWVPQDGHSRKIHCYIDKDNISFYRVDNKVMQRWRLTDKKILFFSPHGISDIKTLYCSTEPCLQCPPITIEQWNHISKEQEQLRTTFLYIPISVLQNNNGSWKKNGDLLFSATIAAKHYDIYLIELQSQLKKHNGNCSYDRALQEFYEQQKKKFVSKVHNKRILLVWLLGIALPFYTCCEKKEIKSIFTFIITNLFFKMCKLR